MYEQQRDRSVLSSEESSVSHKIAHELRAAQGEGAAPVTGQSSDASSKEGRPDLISVGAGDDTVTRIQLAARWAERFSPGAGDDLTGMLKRFRAAYEYLDSVTHGVEPSTRDGHAES